MKSLFIWQRRDGTVEAKAGAEALLVAEEPHKGWRAPSSYVPPCCVTFKRFPANGTGSFQGSRRRLKTQRVRIYIQAGAGDMLLPENELVSRVVGSLFLHPYI